MTQGGSPDTMLGRAALCMRWGLAASPAVALLVVVAGLTDAVLDAQLAARDRGGWFHLAGERARVGGGELRGHARLPDLLDVRLEARTPRTTLAHGVAVNQAHTSPYGSIQALEGYATTSHASGNVSLALGTIGHAEHVGSGTLKVARGVSGGAGLSGEGPVRLAASVYAEPVFRLGPGTIAKAVGLYIARQAAGEDNYAIVAELPTATFALRDAGVDPDGAWIVVEIDGRRYVLRGTPADQRGQR